MTSKINIREIVFHATKEYPIVVTRILGTDRVIGHPLGVPGVQISYKIEDMEVLEDGSIRVLTTVKKREVDVCHQK